MAAGSTKNWNYTIGIRIFQEERSEPVALDALMLNGFPTDEPLPGVLCQAARTLLGLSQQDLADDTGVSKLHINNYENELKPMAPKTIARLRTFFEIGGARFVGGDGYIGVITTTPRMDFEQQTRSSYRKSGRKKPNGRAATAASAPGTPEDVEAPRRRGRPRKVVA